MLGHFRDCCYPLEYTFFDTNQMYFSCHGRRVFEDGNIQPSLGNLQITYFNWYQTVDMYTQRALTYASDELPALSGLSRYVYEKQCRDSQSPLGSIKHYDYVAGLWRGQFKSRTLCWGHSLGMHLVSPFLRNPPCYRAPSWSWASLVGNLASNYMRYRGILSNPNMSTFEVWRP